ncbi:uncharacterized protein [Watersipora subatra]|uniref:uncharacterized protein n=1 Tax=Watersipora subatra TaxID=2589382 RepID=UPI00355C61A8
MRCLSTTFSRVSSRVSQIVSQIANQRVIRRVSQQSESESESDSESDSKSESDLESESESESDSESASESDSKSESDSESESENVLESESENESEVGTENFETVFGSAFQPAKPALVIPTPTEQSTATTSAAMLGDGEITESGVLTDAFDELDMILSCLANDDMKRDLESLNEDILIAAAADRVCF